MYTMDDKIRQLLTDLENIIDDVLCDFVPEDDGEREQFYNKHDSMLQLSGYWLDIQKALNNEEGN